MQLLFRMNLIFCIVCLLTRQFPSLEGYSTQGLLNGGNFDFIVVGAGTAGCVIAARLAENGKHTVLLIEEGGIPNPELDIPYFSPAHAANPDSVKLYPTVPHSNAALARNGIFQHTVGRMLGGTSGVHAMILNRGSPHDYNNWARLTGDESWNYANMLKYFRKYENYTGDHPSDQRGFHGPMTISRHQYAPGSKEWLQAGRELGYPVAEPNGPQIISFSRLEYTRKHGRRVSSYKGYIEPMLQSTANSFHTPGKSNNLLILIHTEATRIIFEGNRAVGVKFTSNSTVMGYAKARKEIIMTAGAVDSAALLMRSGVGPKSVLDKANIPPIKYLPVGRNLHDHPSVVLTVVLGNKSAALNIDTDLTAEAWRIYNEFGDGPYTSYAGQSNEAFLTSSIISPYEKELGWADIQILPMSSNAQGVLGGGSEVNNLQEWEIAVRWSSLVARPKSRGSVTLNSSNIDGIPLIDYGFFTHPDDVQVMIDGIKLSLKVCEETPAFRKIGCRIPNDVLPACGHLKFRSDDYWECYGTQLTGFGLHTVGTCRMGRGPNDPEAVVDSKLRVLGIEGLRVADASILPAIINANTQAAVYAIAEKAAEMILNRWVEGSSKEDFSPTQLFSWPNPYEYMPQLMV